MKIYQVKVMDQCDGARVEYTKYFVNEEAAKDLVENTRFYGQINSSIQEIEAIE